MIKLMPLISESVVSQGEAHLKGMVRIYKVGEENDWKIGRKKYKMEFCYDTTHHPDKKKFGGDCGIEFSYQIPDETTYNSLKQYEGKLVKANWSLDNLQNKTVTKFSVSNILGDIPENNY